MRGRHIENADESDLHQLHGVQTWTPQTIFDRALARIYISFVTNRHYIAYVVLGAVLLANFSVSLAGLVLNPVVGVLTFISVIPAAFVAVYIWDSDPTKKSNAIALSMTFAVGLIVIGFAYLVNNYTLSYFTSLPVLGMTLFFFLIVAPVEEGLKMVTVYLYPSAGNHLETAVDGAVFGAIAGLGFGTGENALYIVTGSFLGPAGITETVIGRAGVAPAHVLWSAIAGYYIGLANLNREYAAVIVLKGFLIAAILHGFYNTMVTYTPAFVGGESRFLSPELYTFTSLGLYYSVVWYSLEKLLQRYRRVTRKYGLG